MTAITPAFAASTNHHALLIGISRYDAKTGASPLPGVPHDLKSATQIAQALGIPAANIRTLTDNAATKAAIVRELEVLTQRVAEGGRALIYFSGHGTRWFDSSAGGCVEGLYTFEGATLVNRELAALAKPLGDKADKLIVMFDACHSGGVTAPGRTRSLPGAPTPKFFVRASDSQESCAKPSNLRTRSLFGEVKGLGAISENIVHISSSRPDEVSFDDPARGGLATQSVRDCMLGGARDLDQSGGITLAEIEQCARVKVREKLQGHPGLLPHHPTITGQRNLLALNQQRREEERQEEDRRAEQRREEARRAEQRREAERLEAQRRESQQREAQQQEAQRLAREQAAQQQAREDEARRLAAQRAQALRLEQERLAREAEEAQRREQAAELARQRERAEFARREQERLEAERRELERQAQQRAEQEKLARETAERARLAAERQRLEEEARQLAAIAREHAERLRVEATLAAQQVRDESPVPPASATLPQGPVATLHDVLAQQDPRRRVNIKLRQSRLRIGQDELALAITSPRDGYLYVIHIEADLQNFTLLFPNRLHMDNRVRAGQTVNLPRLDWRLVSAGPPGISRVLTVVSAEPRDISRVLAVSAEGPFTQLSTAPEDRHRLIDFVLGANVASGQSPFGAAIVEVEEIR